MAPDLLSTICREIDERLNELRPLLAERERLLVAADALFAAEPEAHVSTMKEPAVKDGHRDRRARVGRRGSAAGAIERAATAASGVGLGREAGPSSTARPQGADVERAREPRRGSVRPERAARGAAREAILGALEHGSHTVGELVVVTAMSATNINGNLRRLVAEGVVVRAEREGKAAWALAEAGAD